MSKKETITVQGAANPVSRPAGFEIRQKRVLAFVMR
jgi:hypothetical protein